jgi:hypothetical protein
LPENGSLLARSRLSAARSAGEADICDAERLECASCEPHNDRATAEDRDVDRHVFNAGSTHKSDDDLSG